MHRTLSRPFMGLSLVLFTTLLTGCDRLVRLTLPTPFGPVEFEFDPEECEQHKDGSATCTLCPVQDDVELSDEVRSDIRPSSGECIEYTFSPDEVREFKKRYTSAVIDAIQTGDYEDMEVVDLRL